MAISQFGFLPWLRQGLSGQISQVDSTSLAGSSERTALQVEVAYTGGTVPQNVQLVGPGDIVGIDRRNIIRTEPADYTFNLEENYLPFIEFFEEDFPWRYTPSKRDQDQRLRPWLALIVLKESEFTLLPPAAGELPMILNITAALSDVFHPHDEHWAWAHVHVNQPNAGGSGTQAQNLINNLTQDLKKDPNIAFSRLLSSRRLEPETNYTAFLIPAFETGRLAGLGKPTGSIGSLLPAWNLSSPLPGAYNPSWFPVYTQWRFGTSSLGDFETLATALKPIEANPDLGGVTMDISRSGAGLDTLFKGTTPTVTASTVEMEGALKPPAFQQRPAQNISASPLNPGSISSPVNPYSPYTQQLLSLLNLSTFIQGTGFSSVSNPYLPGLQFQVQGPPIGPAVDDPVVLPPIYGQWHANKQVLDSNSPLWLQELNLDPRYRAAAALGARIIKENKNRYLETAWRQVGEVLLVNDRIEKAKLAQEASRSIFNKHLIGHINIAGVSGDEKFSTVTKISAPAMKRIVATSFTSTSSLIQGNTLKRAAQYSPMTQSVTDSGFRKLTRNRAETVKKIDPTQVAVKAQLTAQMNLGNVTTAKPIIDPSATIATQTILANVQLSNASNGGLSGLFTVMNNTSPGYKVYQESYDALKATLKVYNDRQAQLVLPAIVLNQNAANDITTQLDPATTISERTLNAIRLQYKGYGLTASLGLKPIMAYPVIDDPMYAALEQISTDYLLPNLGQYQSNSVTVLESNNKFIEAYLAGLNHEFARELLWQEYPTDQRGSYFRRFWDVNDTVNMNPANDSYLYDIDMMHLWQSSLGSNNTLTRHGAISSSGGYLVLVIRGELLKKYPNTLIYVQKAMPAVAPSTARRLSPPTFIGTYPDMYPDPATLRLPVFKAHVQPDVVLLGFDLDKTDAVGNSTNPGWFFVFKERPGQIRFALEAGDGGAGPLASWNDMSWDHMAMGSISHATVRTNVADISPYVGQLNNNTSNNGGVNWGSNASEIAWILFKQPVLMAIHADDMID